MDNMYEPPGGEPTEGSHPTEQFWPMSQGPGVNHGPGNSNPGDQDPRYQGPQGGPGYGPRRRNPLHWTVGLVAAAALGAGGIVAGVSLAGHSSPAASPAAASSAAGPGSQAAALNTALNSADASSALTLTSSSSGASASGGSTAVSHPCVTALKTARADRKAGRLTAARAALRAAGARCRTLRHRLFRVALRRGIDGQFTFRGQGGTIRTVAFQRGIVQSVSGSSVIVHAADGTTWTWDLVSNSVVRESGKKTTTSALATGEPVWVGGPVISGAKDARLVIVKPPSGSSSSSSPSPAPSASSSAGSGS
jgi:hypothetical protein